jgi:hypothetical protein
MTNYQFKEIETESLERLFDYVAAAASDPRLDQERKALIIQAIQHKIESAYGIDIWQTN